MQSIRTKGPGHWYRTDEPGFLRVPGNPCVPSITAPGCYARTEPRFVGNPPSDASDVRSSRDSPGICHSPAVETSRPALSGAEGSGPPEIRIPAGRPTAGPPPLPSCSVPGPKGPPIRTSMIRRMVPLQELLESLRQSFADPVTRHAMLVHFPIAVSILAIPFVAALPFIARKKATLYRILLATMLFLTAVIAWQATEAGEEGAKIVEARLATPQARDVLKRHEIRGERVPLLMAATSGLVAFTLVRGRGVALTSGLAATAASVATGVVVVLVSHDGGRLVHHLDRPPAVHSPR